MREPTDPLIPPPHSLSFLARYLQILIDLLLFLKLIQLMKIRRLLESQYLKFEQSNHYYTIASMIFSLMTIAHFIAAIWNLINVIEIQF